MFTLRVRNPFGCHGVSCVKLPAAVAFPTDDRLLKRIEESRRALPQDNMKSLRKRHEPLSVVSASVQRVRTFPQLVRIDELCLRSRAAVGQR